MVKTETIKTGKHPGINAGVLPYIENKPNIARIRQKIGKFAMYLNK